MNEFNLNDDFLAKKPGELYGFEVLPGMYFK
jgi:hypothetical protein